MKENNLELLEGESILFQAKSQKEDNFTTWVAPMSIGFPIIPIFSLFVFYIEEESRLVFFIFLVTIFLPFILLSIDDLLKANHSKYYITNIRAVIVPGKGLIPFKLKNRQILLEEIACIENCRGDLLLVNKGKNNDVLYNGEEIAIYRDIPKEINRIWFSFKDREEKTINQAIDLLVELCSLETHPNIDDLYISTAPN